MIDVGSCGRDHRRSKIQKKMINFGKKLPVKKKKYMGPYKLLQPPRWWSRPHVPTSIMANAQQKIEI